MRPIRPLLLLGALAVAACDLQVNDPNSGSIERLRGDATRADVEAAVQGIFYSSRDVHDWYLPVIAPIARDGYYLDPVNAEFITALLGSAFDPGRFYVTLLFNPPYATIRLGNEILGSLEGGAGFSDTEQEAIRGFVKTMQAHELLTIAGIFDESGAPVDVAGDPAGEPAPVLSKVEVYERIRQLLDEGRTHLAAGGATFPFTLTEGFSGFASPAAFVGVNRALRARADVYAGAYADALTDLSESFLDPAAPLSAGVFHSYTTNAGDKRNPLYDPDRVRIHGHPSLITGAQTRGDGSLDLRVQAKVQESTARTVLGIPVSLGLTVYNSPSAPIPVIRNEELILLRAEANLGLGNYPAAADDINLIRQGSGGLEPLADLETRPPEAILDELLYNKRYSLLWEGAHRWIDLRRYGRLETLPKFAPEHVIWPYFALPTTECVTRSSPPPGCTMPAPL